jgi:hypothetical protein
MVSAKWYDLGSKAKAWGRRGSSISVNTPSVPVEVDEVESGLKGLELHKREEEEEDEEVYIDFDRIWARAGGNDVLLIGCQKSGLDWDVEGGFER